MSPESQLAEVFFLDDYRRDPDPDERLALIFARERRDEFRVVSDDDGPDAAA